MNIRKSRVLVYFEFFKEQDLIKLEEQLRYLEKTKRIPSFHKLTIFVHHKGLRTVRTSEFLDEKEIPFVVDKNDLEKDEQEKIH